MNLPTYNPVYKVMNKPLTVWGIERRLFFVAMVLGVATFTLFETVLGSIAMFAGLFLLARHATRTDAQILRILMNSSRFRLQYDPAKRAFYNIQAIRNDKARQDR